MGIIYINTSGEKSQDINKRGYITNFDLSTKKN